MTSKNHFAALMATLPPSAVDAAFGYLGAERVTAALQANDTPDKKKQLMGAMRLWVYASMQDVHQLLSAALRREISQDYLYQYLEKGFLTASLKGWVEEDHLQAGEWLSAIERQLMVPASELRSRVFRERNIIADLGPVSG